jgi:hypothetical protein
MEGQPQHIMPALKVRRTLSLAVAPLWRFSLAKYVVVNSKALLQAEAAIS